MDQSVADCLANGIPAKGNPAIMKQHRLPIEPLILRHMFNLIIYVCDHQHLEFHLLGNPAAN
jgi:hypothetical protein